MDFGRGRPSLIKVNTCDSPTEEVDWSEEMAKRVEGIPNTEIDAAFDEAVEFVRHNRR